MRCRYIFGLMGSINLGKRCIMIAMVGETEHDRRLETDRTDAALKIIDIRF
jgi:hypothetical protein